MVKNSKVCGSVSLIKSRTDLESSSPKEVSACLKLHSHFSLVCSAEDNK